MEHNEIVSFIKSVCDNVRAYSGRAMYGRRCVAVDLNDNQSAADTVLEIIHAAVTSGDVSPNDLIHLLEMLGDSKADSMGLGQVLYWPHLQIVE